jgi:hypothetical protein
MKAEVIFKNGIPVTVELTAEKPFDEKIIRDLWLGIKPIAMEVANTGSKITLEPLDLKKWIETKKQTEEKNGN